MQIIPLTCSMIDWKSFVKFGNLCVPNIVQGIQSNTEIGRAATILAKIKNQKQLDFSFFHLSVGLICDRKLINELYDLQLYTIWKEQKEDEIYAILSGSIEDWKSGCIEKHKSTQVRKFFNGIFLLLEKAAGETVNEWHKVASEDGTFTLTKRF